LGPDAPQPPGYVREVALGTGATGKVYAARRADDGRVVALRLLNAELTQGQDGRRLLRRARRLLALRRRGLATYFDCGLFEDQVFVVRELASGRNPTAEDPKRPWRDVAASVRELAVSLRALHQLGHVHGRLGTSDVWISARGSVTLTDFGLLSVTRGTPSTAAFSRAVDDDRVAFCRIAAMMLRPLQPPRRLLRALEAGQAIDAASPYCTMNELIGCLDREMESSPVVRLAPVVALVGVLGFVSTDSFATMAGPACEPAIPDWGIDAKTGLRDAFRRTGDPSADAVATRTEVLIDQYVDGVLDAGRAACESKPEPQPEALTCQRVHVAAVNILVDELTRTKSPRVVRSALHGVAALPDSADCSADEPRAARILAALGQREKAEALARLRLEATGADPEQRALALVDLGAVLRPNLPGQAEATLLEAHELARSAGADRARVEAGVELLRLAIDGNDQTQVRRWTSSVETATETLGANDPLSPTALEVIADARARLEESDAAIVALRRALQQRSQQGTSETSIARLQDKLARLLVERGELSEAESLAAKAWSSRMRNLGPEHPEVARSHRTMALLAESRAMPYAAKHHADAASELLRGLDDLDRIEQEG
jgi:tRNA A-37 threonylcarbamoyl transferase component Bud32